MHIIKLILKNTDNRLVYNQIIYNKIVNFYKRIIINEFASILSDQFLVSYGYVKYIHDDHKNKVKNLLKEIIDIFNKDESINQLANILYNDIKESTYLYMDVLGYFDIHKTIKNKKDKNYLIFLLHKSYVDTFFMQVGWEHFPNFLNLFKNISIIKWKYDETDEKINDENLYFTLETEFLYILSGVKYKYYTLVDQLDECVFQEFLTEYFKINKFYFKKILEKVLIKISRNYQSFIDNFFESDYE